MEKRIGLLGLGAYVPERVMTNDDWAEFVDTSDEWITSRTGIKRRRIAADDESTADLAVAAALMIVVGAISVVLKLGVEKRLLVASLRTIVQLLLIGFILDEVFALKAQALALRKCGRRGEHQACHGQGCECSHDHDHDLRIISGAP